MNKKQRATLSAIFKKPTAKSLSWADIEKLLLGLDGEVLERGGSRVAVILNGHIAHFHRPHPQKEAKPYQVEAARNLLVLAGVQP